MKVFRIKNSKDIFFIILIQLATKFGFINQFSFLKKNFSNYHFFLVIITSICITLSGFLINSYIHRSNKNNIKRNKILLLFILTLSLIAIFISIYVPIKTEKPYNIVIGIGIWLIVLIISYTANKPSFAKDLLISFFSSSLFLITWWLHSPSHLPPEEWKLFLKLEIIIIFFTLLTFIGMITRTIFISLINQKSDLYYNNFTLPIVFGITKTKTIIKIIYTLSILLSLSICYFFIHEINTILLFLSPSLICSLLLYRKINITNNTIEDNKYVVKIIDITFIIGLIVIIPLSTFIIKHANI